MDLILQKGKKIHLCLGPGYEDKIYLTNIIGRIAGVYEEETNKNVLLLQKSRQKLLKVFINTNLIVTEQEEALARTRKRWIQGLTAASSKPSDIEPLTKKGKYIFLGKTQVYTNPPRPVGRIVGPK